MTLNEWDVSSGGGIQSMRDDGWVALRGLRAQVTVVKTPSGREHTEVTWAERGRLFEITVDRQVSKRPAYPEIKAYAESLP